MRQGWILIDAEVSLITESYDYFEFLLPAEGWECDSFTLNFFDSDFFGLQIMKISFLIFFFYDHSAQMFWSFDTLILVLIFRTLWLKLRWNFILGFLLRWSFISPMGHPIHRYCYCSSEVGDTFGYLKSIKKLLDFQMF